MAEVEVLPEGSPINDLLDKSDADFLKAIGMNKEEPKAETPPAETPVAETPVVETPATEVPVAETPAAETPVAEAPKEELPKLLTEFAVKDAEGELEIPRDLKFDFKANKKEYKDVPIDKVVLLAQMGVYNQDLQDEVHDAKIFVSETKKENEQLRAVVGQLRDRFEDLLGDEQLYDAARVKWAEQNSPEKRAERAEQTLRQRQENEQRQAQVQQATAYIASDIYPVVESVVKAHPSLSEDEVLGRFNRLIAPYLEQGAVPPHRLREVKAVLEKELPVWATQVSLTRGEQTKKQEKAVQAAKTQATLAKRQVARAVKPVPSVAPTKEVKKPRVYESADDWLNHSLEEIMEKSRSS